LTKWSIYRGWGSSRRASLDQWLAARPVLSGDEDVSRIWGELAGYAARRGRPRPVNDTWIAACCLAFGLPLATLNAGDFQDFVDHERSMLVTA
jgi:predicted nucleic acid-binding protein